MESKESISPLLKSIRNDVKIIGHVMHELTTHVLQQEVSQYPMYIATQDEIPIGRPFLDKETYHLNWYYRASVLEEFVKHKLIERDKLEDFMETFGDPGERACIFVFLPNEGGFVFIPYEVGLEEEEDLKLYDM